MTSRYCCPRLGLAALCTSGVPLFLKSETITVISVCNTLGSAEFRSDSNTTAQVGAHSRLARGEPVVNQRIVRHASPY